MRNICELSIVIPTFPSRAAKLEALLRSIAATTSDRGAFEVVVVVDDLDESPLRLACEVLPRDISLQGHTQPHHGPARARNLAIEHARGAWLLILDDDIAIDRDTIPGHLLQIRQDPQAELAYLGRADWPPGRLDCPWHRLLAESAMLFFWNTMWAGERYNFRHFWSGHVSVRTDLVRAVGGFDERFPDAMHEDIELGWRLQQRCGLQIQPLMDVRGWHDHPMSPREYLLREYRAGRSAAAARTINGPFHDEVWGRLGDVEQTLATLERLFLLSARQMLRLFERWTEPSDDRLSDSELQTAYLAHLPLKRMLFCQGYLGRPFEQLWDAVAEPVVEDCTTSQRRPATPVASLSPR